MSAEYCAKEGKIQYPTRTLAQRAVVSIERRRKGNSEKPMRVYQCVECGAFHIGHPKDKPAAKLMAGIQLTRKTEH